MTGGNGPISVAFFQRAPVGGFSLENVFDLLRQHLPPGEVEWAVHVSSWRSRGLLPRLAGGIEAGLRQGARVNHVAGDVHYLALFLEGARTVLTIADVEVLLRTAGVRRTLLEKVWYGWPERHVAAVTTISHAARREICGTLGWPEQRVDVIPLAVGPEFRPSPRQFRGELPTILQVGTAANKNLPRLARALQGLPVRLEVVGRLSAEQREVLLESGVPFAARENLTRDEIVAAYEAADLVTLVSTVEGFGLPILEAQAVERVVVTSACSSMPEVAGEGAVLVDPLDEASIREGIVRVIGDAGLREGLLEKGRRNRARYAPGKVAASYLDVYRRVARVGKGAPRGR